MKIMKVDNDIWNIAANTIRSVPIEANEANQKKANKRVVVQSYLAGIRMQCVGTVISDEQADTLLHICKYVHSKNLFTHTNASYTDYTFAYGIQEGLRLARAYIDHELQRKDQPFDANYLAGYKAARSAIGKWHCVFGTIEPKGNYKMAE